ncbi:hypothetical protein [Fictibacillus phosphorivorans]|uniref:hypothetical protein n=1 Tax=Fictibacillus phosphorivorans TaxID=1221500 RepID=UPI001292D325|nr:hypothetical protein [Fictibacillus phosphorivorans]MQR94192.1 hypothetical protein [Fictibacillus phosphorivorans]
MKEKGSVKKAGFPVFWAKHEKNVPEKLKEMIYHQYFSRDILYIYCDMSMIVNYSTMTIACSYVSNGNVQVKQQYVYPPQDSINKNIYGEIKAVIFALTHFEKYIGNCTNVIIYSDVKAIEAFLKKDSSFKKGTSLLKLQNEMLLIYERARSKHPQKTITIQYLIPEQKTFNPFYRSAHNAAKNLLIK